MITLLDPTPEATRHLLVDIVYERVAGQLAEARPGHCLRVSALPEPVMRAVCERFHAPNGAPPANGDEPAANVVLLLGPRQTPAHAYEVTATRLIELRNDGGRPLLAFVPPGLKAAAEDSFDVSTFVEIDLADAAGQLRRHGARGPRHWARLIATDPAWADLAFDNWIFDDEVNQERVLIWFDDLPLPRRQPDQPPGHDTPPHARHPQDEGRPPELAAGGQAGSRPRSRPLPAGMGRRRPHRHWGEPQRPGRQDPERGQKQED